MNLLNSSMHIFAFMGLENSSKYVTGRWFNFVSVCVCLRIFLQIVGCHTHAQAHTHIYSHEDAFKCVNIYICTCACVCGCRQCVSADRVNQRITINLDLFDVVRHFIPIRFSEQNYHFYSSFFPSQFNFSILCLFLFLLQIVFIQHSLHFLFISLAYRFAQFSEPTPCRHLFFLSIVETLLYFVTYKKKRRKWF